METLLGLCAGVALAASCGFRVFVPLLVLSLGARAGWITPGEHFEWMASWPALSAFGVASIVEVGAYFWPWLDHALDTIASPIAVVAGTLAVASQVDHMHPVLTWLTGVVAGGGAAGITQAATVTTRGASTASTAGLLNPVLSGVQGVVAAVLSVLAVVVPIVAGFLALVLIATVGVVAYRVARRLHRRRSPGTMPRCASPR
jgi:hypothetical protein